MKTSIDSLLIRDCYAADYLEVQQKSTFMQGYISKADKLPVFLRHKPELDMPKKAEQTLMRPLLLFTFLIIYKLSTHSSHPPWNTNLNTEREILMKLFALAGKEMLTDLTIGVVCSKT